MELDVIAFPENLRKSPLARRLEIAARAIESAGAALLAVRGSTVASAEHGDQLKTSVDRAVEGWVLGWLEGEFEGDAVLAEERFSSAGRPWPPTQDYWTVDALDGTRSFVEGFPGFCVQVAWVEGGRPRLGVVGEPVAGALYFAVEGEGAWRVDGKGATRIHVTDPIASPPRFVDSIRPSGVVGRWMEKTSAAFVECGSCGLKLARIAEGTADIYAKEFRYRLWDVAPGQVLLDEAGGQLCQWDGSPIRFDGTQVEHTSMLVSAGWMREAALAELR